MDRGMHPTEQDFVIYSTLSVIIFVHFPSASAQENSISTWVKKVLYESENFFCRFLLRIVVDDLLSFLVVISSIIVILYISAFRRFCYTTLNAFRGRRFIRQLLKELRISKPFILA